MREGGARGHEGGLVAVVRGFDGVEGARAHIEAEEVLAVGRRVVLVFYLLSHFLNIRNLLVDEICIIYTFMLYFNMVF